MGIAEELAYMAQQSAIKNQEAQTNSIQAQLPYMMQEQAKQEATLVGQTNPRPLIDDLIHYYRCEIEMPDGKGGKKWSRPDGIKPLMNELGVHSVIIDVYSIVNQGTVLSNITDEDVANLTIQIHMNLIEKLGSDAELFELENSNLNTVLWTTSNMCYMALKRALNQGERGFLKKVVFSNENRTFGPTGKTTENKKFWEVWK